VRSTGNYPFDKTGSPFSSIQRNQVAREKPPECGPKSQHETVEQHCEDGNLDIGYNDSPLGPAEFVEFLTVAFGPVLFVLPLARFFFVGLLAGISSSKERLPASPEAHYESVRLFVFFEGRRFAFTGFAVFGGGGIRTRAAMTASTGSGYRLIGLRREGMGLAIRVSD
jgi:hypothetical protein